MEDDFTTPISNEFVSEQADALGEAGERLQLSLDQYKAGLAQHATPEQHKTLLNDVVEKVWELMVLRETLGFYEYNLEWIIDGFDLPSEVIARVRPTHLTNE